MQHLNFNPKLRVYKRNKTWWVSFADKTVPGGKARYSCRTSRYDEAKQKAREVVASHFKAKELSFDPSNVDFSELHRLDCARARREHMPEKNMRLTIDYFWARLKEFFEPGNEPCDPFSLRLADIESYIDHRIAQGIKPQTYKREVQALKRMILKAADLNERPAPTFQWPRIGAAASDDAAQAGKYREAELLDAFIEGITDDECRDLCILVRETGVRRAEAFRLEWDMFLPGSKNEHLAGNLLMPGRITKNKCKRTVPLSPDALDAAMRQKLRRGKVADREPLFPMSLYEESRAYINAANATLDLAQPIHLRDLRHTFGCLLLKEGLGVKATVTIMGHKTIAAADRYQTYVGDWGEEAMARLVQARTAQKAARNLAGANLAQIGGHVQMS